MAKKQKQEVREIDFYKLSLMLYKGMNCVFVGIYKILCATIHNYQQYKSKKDLKTYIRLREKYINISCSDEGYKKDMMTIDMGDYKPKTIVDMRDIALLRYINRQMKVIKDV